MPVTINRKKSFRTKLQGAIRSFCEGRQTIKDFLLLILVTAEYLVS